MEKIKRQSVSPSILENNDRAFSLDNLVGDVRFHLIISVRILRFACTLLFCVSFRLTRGRCFNFHSPSLCGVVVSDSLHGDIVPRRGSRTTLRESSFYNICDEVRHRQMLADNLRRHVNSNERHWSKERLDKRSLKRWLSVFNTKTSRYTFRKLVLPKVAIFLFLSIFKYVKLFLSTFKYITQ